MELHADGTSVLFEVLLHGVLAGEGLQVLFGGGFGPGAAFWDIHENELSLIY